MYLYQGNNFVSSQESAATTSLSGPQISSPQSTADHAFSAPQESAILQLEAAKTAASLLGIHATSNKTDPHLSAHTERDNSLAQLYRPHILDNNDDDDDDLIQSTIPSNRCVTPQEMPTLPFTISSVSAPVAAMVSEISVIGVQKSSKASDGTIEATNKQILLDVISTVQTSEDAPQGNMDANVVQAFSTPQESAILQPGVGETTASLFEMHAMSNKTVLDAQLATEDQTATFSSSGPQTTTAQSTAKHAFSTPQESAILQPETAASLLGMHATSIKTVLDAQLVVKDQTVSASGKQHSIPFQEPTLHCPIHRHPLLS